MTLKTSLIWAMLRLLVLYASLALHGLSDKVSVPREVMKSLHDMCGLRVLALGYWLMAIHQSGLRRPLAGLGAGQRKAPH